jgi:tetratricopeptide (TPR) repeat protein
VGHTEGLAKSLSVLGQVLLSLAYYEKALTSLSEAAEWFRKLDDVRSEAETLARMARIHEETGGTDEAERGWQRIAELLEHLDPIMELDVVEAFGRLARKRGDEAEALSHYHDAIELAVHLHESSREASLRNTVGILEWNRGHYREALAQYEQALPLFEAASIDGGVGLMLNSIASCLRSLHRHEDALDVLHDALAVHRQAGNRKMEAHALSLLGDALLETERTDAALKAYADSLQLRWDLDDRHGEGWMLQRMARAYTAQGDAERAASYGKQAHAVARELDDPALEEACRALTGQPSVS